MVPQICDYAGNTDATCLQIGNLSLYFSFKTVIAFRKDGKLVISENVWTRTTAKHLSAIPGQKDVKRIPYTEFESLLSEVCKDI